MNSNLARNRSFTRNFTQDSVVCEFAASVWERERVAVAGQGAMPR